MTIRTCIIGTILRETGIQIPETFTVKSYDREQHSKYSDLYYFTVCAGDLTFTAEFIAYINCFGDVVSFTSLNAGVYRKVDGYTVKMEVINNE